MPKRPSQNLPTILEALDCGGPFVFLRWVRVKSIAGSRTGTSPGRAALAIELLAGWSVRNLGFRSPIPQIVCVESDAEKIARKESEFRRSQSDDTEDDAVCSRNDPALP